MKMILMLYGILISLIMDITEKQYESAIARILVLRNCCLLYLMILRLTTPMPLN